MNTTDERHTGLKPADTWQTITRIVNAQLGNPDGLAQLTTVSCAALAASDHPLARPAAAAAAGLQAEHGSAARTRLELELDELGQRGDLDTLRLVQAVDTVLRGREAWTTTQSLMYMAVEHVGLHAWIQAAGHMHGIEHADWHMACVLLHDGATVNVALAAAHLCADPPATVGPA